MDVIYLLNLSTSSSVPHTFAFLHHITLTEIKHQIRPHLSGVKLHCKSTWIPQGFRAATLMDNCGEADNDRCLNSRSPEKISTCEARDIMGNLKETLCTGSPSMDNTLWNPLPVKIGKLLHQMVILKEDWTCQRKKYMQIKPQCLNPHSTWQAKIHSQQLKVTLQVIPLQSL